MAMQGADPVSERTVSAWRAQPSAEAARLHYAYIATLEARIERFGMHMHQSGFPLDRLDWSTLDAFDDLWHWAQDHLSLFDDRRMRFAGTTDPWYPYMSGTEIPKGWPSWSGRDDLAVEAHEFTSGVAALLVRHAIVHWDATWVLIDNMSAIEIPRADHHPSAPFGPVHFLPEAAIASAVHSFDRHPLWHAAPPWHALRERAIGPVHEWAELDEDAAERFHDAYVGGHLRRLSGFRDWLLARGLDTTSMGFDHVAEIERIWLWAASNVTFAEHVTVPRTEHREWYPTLAMRAEPASDLPRWSPVNLSPDTLEFASGLAACATEVALRSWGADWCLGGRPGDLAAANRTHLRVQRRDAEPVWIAPDLEIARWLRRAVITMKRSMPRPAVWHAAVGYNPLAQPGMCTARILDAPQPPWVGWHVRFEDRLLPERRSATTPPEYQRDAERWEVAPAAVPMTFTDAAAQRRSTPPPPPTPSAPSRLAPAEPTLEASAPAEGHALHLEPDDLQGDCYWTIQIDPTVAADDPRLIERFASRLNRTRGVSTATLLHPTAVSLRMNRFGPMDVEAVERAVHRVWDQTNATHRAPLPVPTTV